MTTSASDLALRHFKLEIDRHRVAWLGFDMAHSPVNRLSNQAMEELDLTLDHMASKPPAGLVVYSCKSSGFIAGADIDEFAGLDNIDKSLALVARGWKLFNRIGALPWPTLALIQGHCMGGGLELALACRYRLAVDQADTLLALPEVKLGIFPGWGGMMRLPRQIGPGAALDLMLSGKSVNARRAAALGLVDAAVPPRIARQAAAQLVTSGKPPRQAQGHQKLLNHAWVKPLVARQARQGIAKRDPFQHYPAPRAILDIWLEHDGNPLKAPDLVEELTQSTTTRNLLRVFHLQERLKQLGRRADGPPIQHVHVVGAGVMGGDIAAWCALKGLRVTLQDTARERIAQAQGRAADLLHRRLKSRRLVQDALDRLIPDPLGAGVAHADLVIEAIVEDADAKRSLYAQIEPRLKTEAILATNTSSLALTDLGRDLARPQRLVGIHFFNPIARMPLVEIVEAPAADPGVLQRALSFVHQLDKLPLPVQDSPGFLVNAVLAPYMLEAMRCVDEGMAPATVDQAMLEFGMPMGPLELADTVGLDVASAAGSELGGTAGLPACLQARLEKNELGRKTGQGFYEWDAGKAQKGAAAAVPPGLTERLLQPLLDKAAECVRLGVVADDDLADAGIIFGTGFAPFRGGPLHYARTGLDIPV